MNYSIINFLADVERFVEWLPELKADETYYVCLFARNKYVRDSDSSFPYIRSDKAQMKRFTTKKEFLIPKLRQLETAYGTYLQKGRPVPQEALVVYINPNPRSEWKAARNSLKKIADLITRKYEGWSLRQEVMSEIHKARGTTHFVDFDFDVDDAHKNSCITMLQRHLPKILNDEAYSILETRGGYHVLVHVQKIEKQYLAHWHQRIRGLGADVVGDNMIPIPGCYQGGFTPKFIKQ